MFNEIIDSDIFTPVKSRSFELIEFTLFNLIVCKYQSDSGCLVQGVLVCFAHIFVSLCVCDVIVSVIVMNS